MDCLLLLRLHGGVEAVFAAATVPGVSMVDGASVAIFAVVVPGEDGGEAERGIDGMQVWWWRWYVAGKMMSGGCWNCRSAVAGVMCGEARIGGCVQVDHGGDAVASWWLKGWRSCCSAVAVDEKDGGRKMIAPVSWR
ncbi:hypothetical protein DEO72_LG10g2438 [Vigna unguiculata]|uniref:Uncharacterized protein n=1 Tax=Vigna unguiculata TaxID=3917 RepID=A0A4D6NGB0_VIGUN|nr:hypothetical protein DEO72_LG10g2438 [Vigna unguiculata]